MGHVNTVFHQILAEIPRALVEKVSRGHHADHYVKSFRTWDHLVAMLFAQAAGKDSLRDLAAAFNSIPQQLYHLGVGLISRSTLADANTRRSSQLFEQLYLQLFNRFLALMPRRKFKFKNPFFAFDSTFIELCLAAFSRGTRDKIPHAQGRHQTPLPAQPGIHHPLPPRCNPRQNPRPQSRPRTRQRPATGQHRNF